MDQAELDKIEDDLQELDEFWYAIQNPHNQIHSMRLYVSRLELALDIIRKLLEEIEE